MVAEEHAHDLGVAEGQVCDESDGFAVVVSQAETVGGRVVGPRWRTLGSI